MELSGAGSIVRPSSILSAATCALSSRFSRRRRITRRCSVARSAARALRTRPIRSGPLGSLMNGDKVARLPAPAKTVGTHFIGDASTTAGLSHGGVHPCQSQAGAIDGRSLGGRVEATASAPEQ